MPVAAELAQADGAGRSSATERAYAALRDLAMTYRLPPGQGLNEVALARLINVSRTPLREAMNRLVSEGLLIAHRGKGFSARKLDVNEVFELYETRLALESAIVDMACERATAEGLDRLDAYLDDSVAVQEAAPIDRLVQLDEGFHERVAALAANSELKRLLRNVNARIHFFRWVDMHGRRDKTQREHRALVAAIRAQDKAAAGSVLRAHITRRLEEIVEVVREGYGRLYMGEGPGAAALVAQSGEEVK